MSILKRALLVGYYGYGNVGDEILMGVSMDILKNHDFEVSILYPTPGTMGDVRLVDRFNLFSVLKEIVGSKVVVFGGGGIFQDKTSFKSLLYYTSIAFVSIILGRKVILLGNSIGPLKRRLSRFLVRRILKSKNVIVFPRDPVTRRYSSLLSGKVYRGTDLAVIYLKDRKRDSSREKMALIFPKHMSEWWNVARYLEDEGYRVVFSSASPEDEKICEIYSKDYDYETGDVVDLISRSSIVVSERFHPCLISAYFGIPFVSVGEKKTERFFKYILRSYPGFSKKEESDIMVRIDMVKDSRIDVADRLLEDANAMMEKLDKILKNL